MFSIHYLNRLDDDATKILYNVMCGSKDWSICSIIFSVAQKLPFIMC